MYELCSAGENSYYIQSPAKIGVIKLDDENVCLIDSGSDKDAGRKVKKILDENGWRLTAIYNTHSHADHIGGNQYLQNQYRCKIYAPCIECDFINHPILEPTFLYGGFVPNELKHKFLLAKESNAQPLEESKLPDGMSIINLPGHFFNMVGYRTCDDVIFLADCLSSKETLEKYQISFIYDIAEYLNTLEAVKQMDAKLFIPSHAEPTHNIRPLAQINIDKVYEIADIIINICKSPSTFEKLLQSLFEFYKLNMSFEQYALIGSTVRSYLSWLKSDGRIKASFENNELIWISQL
ncbi:MAG TPA: MBL fold metallo-hydrolase [Firmicutes bacterium]|nr:MBL fold metallo-hydrolase [Bacillota bacterium]